MGVGENDLARSRYLAPSDRLCPAVNDTVQVCLAWQHHDAVDPCHHARREFGRCARVIHLPFDDAGGELLVSIELQPELARGDFLEGRRVVLASRDAQAGCVVDGHEGTSIPIGQTASFGEANTLRIVPPIDSHSGGADRLTPIVLHPLRARSWPVAIAAMAVIANALWIDIVVDRRQCFMA